MKRLLAGRSILLPSCVVLLVSLFVCTLNIVSDSDFSRASIFSREHESSSHSSTSASDLALPLQSHPFHRVSIPSHVSTVLRCVMSDNRYKLSSFATNYTSVESGARVDYDIDPECGRLPSFLQTTLCAVYFEYAAWNGHMKVFLGRHMTELILLAQRGVDNGDLAILTVDYGTDLQDGKIKIAEVDEVDTNGISQRVIVYRRGAGTGQESHIFSIWDDLPRLCPDITLATLVGAAK